MWLNDLFWGIRNTFVGKYKCLVINDHIWGPSAYVDKSFKNIRAWVRPPPPSRQCLYFGNFCSVIPSLIWQNIYWVERFKLCTAVVSIAVYHKPARKFFIFSVVQTPVSRKSLKITSTVSMQLSLRTTKYHIMQYYTTQGNMKKIQFDNAFCRLMDVIFV